jgi:hypothetical protein
MTAGHMETVRSDSARGSLGISLLRKRPQTQFAELFGQVTNAFAGQSRLILCLGISSTYPDCLCVNSYEGVVFRVRLTATFDFTQSACFSRKDDRKINDFLEDFVTYFGTLNHWGYENDRVLWSRLSSGTFRVPERISP